MKKIKIITKRLFYVFFVISTLLMSQKSSAQSQLDGGEYVPGRILIQFRPKANAAARSQTMQAMRSQGVAGHVELYKHRRLRMMGTARIRPRAYNGQEVSENLAIVTLNEGVTVHQAIENCKKDPNILYAEPDYIVKAVQTLPDDPLFNELWGLHNTGQTGGLADADMDAPEAWEIYQGKEKVLVGVLDTGIDYNHEDLNANMWQNPVERDGMAGVDDDGNGFVDDIYGVDFSNEDGDPMDDNGHGTHVAGTIGAIPNNSIGVTGVAPNVQLMAIKFLDYKGRGSTLHALDAIHYAMDHGVQVLNNSWGFDVWSQSLENLMDEAKSNGMVIVAAAGNDNTSKSFYPAANDGVIAVAAMDRFNRRAHYVPPYATNFGPVVAVSAPGVSIRSTLPNNRYGPKNGTSMAAPHVSGLAALLLSQHPTLDPYQVEYRIRASVDPVNTYQYIGSGHVNAEKVLQNTETFPIAILRTNHDQNRTIQIRGTAGGQWRLSYGLGDNPTQWVDIQSSAIPVYNGILFDGFDTAPLQPGVNTFRLIVDRGNQVEIRRPYVKTSNDPPVVDAGEDQTIFLPDYAVLEGTVTDDGLPNPPGEIVRENWVIESSFPEKAKDKAYLTYIFSIKETRAYFPEPGIYTLRLDAFDGELEGSDRVEISVLESTPTVNNNPPFVDAGEDQEIQLPEFAVLKSTYSDDGLPNPPGKVEIMWSLESSIPTTRSVQFKEIIDFNGESQTRAVFSDSGVYVLRLEAFDGELTSTDTIKITVLASTNNVNNEPPFVDAGENQEIELPKFAVLKSTFSDDGLPNPPGKVETMWSVKSSVPQIGKVEFVEVGSNGKKETHAIFSEPGIYTLGFQFQNIHP